MCSCLKSFFKLNKSTTEKSIKTEIYRHGEGIEDQLRSDKSSLKGEQNHSAFTDIKANASNDQITSASSEKQNILSTTIKLRDAAFTKDAVEKEIEQPNDLPDNASSKLPSFCSTQERHELLQDINQCDPAILKPVKKPVSQEKITPLPIAIICWKSGMHPQDPLSAKLRDNHRRYGKDGSDDDSDDDDEKDLDEWDD